MSWSLLSRLSAKFMSNIGYPDAKGTKAGTIVVFVPGKPEIKNFMTMFKEWQKQGYAANLYPSAFSSDTSTKDRNSFSMMQWEGTQWKEERTNWIVLLKVGCTVLPMHLRVVVLATFAADTAVTFKNCFAGVNTGMVSVMYYDVAAEWKNRQLCHVSRQHVLKARRVVGEPAYWRKTFLTG